MILGILLLALAAAPVSTRDSTSYPSAEALQRYTQGRLLEEEGDIDGALGEYYHVLTSDPRSLEAMRRISDLCAQRGDLNRSLEFAERALVVAPNDARSLWLKGSALFNLGRSTEALASLQKCVAADSEQAEYWRTLGRVAERENRLDLVEHAYEETVDLEDGDAEAWFQLAGARARLGDFAGADSALAQSKDLNPLRPGTDFLQAWIDEGLGNDDSAIEMYKHHLSVHPDDTATRQRLVSLLAGRQRWDEAYREAKRVREARPSDPEALETEADLAFHAGQPQAGEERLRALRALDSNDPQWVWRSAVVLSRHQRAAEGVRLAGDWEKAHPGDWRGPMLLARAESLNNDFDRALAHAREAVSLAPDSLAARVLLGRVSQQAKHWSEAAEVWEKLRQEHPDQPGILLDLAFCKEQMGDVDGSVAVARQALSMAPSQPDVLNFLGYLLADHNRDLAEASELIQKAVAQEPDNGAFIDSLGWVYYRLGRLKEAREQLERAVRLTGGDPVVREHLGDVYRDLKLPELAREQYRKSLASDSTNQRVRSKLEATR
ncbi:MAG TPA: tetratricopeptide repeat protein [Candidatus Sulfotelmatobacter sp.]|nr:tetratricopeptide repeat protein [Candidatus Sulfotelmatobacter sp.]